MKIEKVKLSDLNSPSWNPRYITDEDFRKLKNSIETFGYVDPIIVNRHNMNIVGGNQRYQALKKLGYKEVDVIFINEPNLDKEKALNISLNKISGDWDTEKLNTLLEEIKLSEVDVTLTGFDDTEIKEFGEDFIIDNNENDINTENNKNDDIFYFDNDLIKEHIINNFKKINNLDDFVKMFIDLPKAEWEFNRLCQGYKTGYNISLLFNPHRLDTPTKNSKSFYQCFNDKKYHKEIARFMLEFNNKVPLFNDYPKQVLLGVGGFQVVQEFHPALARDIYKNYCKDGDKILNPCAGWGGRLLGLVSCQFKNIEYWETDPSKKTYEGLLKMKKWLNLNDDYKTFNEGFEDLKVPKNYFNFTFTSPPYFDTELYSKDKKQSYMNKSSYEEWKEKFYYVLIDKILYSLNNDGVAILNVGNNRYPMQKDLCEYLDSLNVEWENTLFNSIGGQGLGKRSGETGEPFIKFFKK